LEANYLATGHYVRQSKSEEGLYSLFKALDHHKDQSYILYTLSQEQLSHALFPLGHVKKTEVREIALSLNLPVANKPESQDLCFLGNSTIKDFLIRQSGQSIEPGPILDINGNKIGEHQGLPFYTIGQRKGLGISSKVPLYVLMKEIQENTIIVGPKTSLGQSELLVSHLNWISGIPPQAPFIADVKIRYKAQFIKTTTVPLPSGDMRVEFFSPLRDITPGQVVVFYNKEECLGGGIIQ
jgi:tRNA-uridine 2-sulfurtransferase